MAIRRCSKSDDGYWMYALKGVFVELEIIVLSKEVEKPTPKKSDKSKKQS